MNKKNIILSVLLICNFIFSNSYYSEIQPIFNQYCISCHQGGNFASGGLDLTSYDNLMNGGNSGSVIIPGNHINSVLWQRIENGEMPAGEPMLSEEMINLIADWIDEDARVCDDGFAYHPEVADNLQTDYTNVTIQDQEYNPCFYENDLEALADIISENNFENISDPFKVGTQTWNSGRLRFLVAGYYFSGVNEVIHTIPESIGQLDDLRSLYLEWNQISTLPDSFTNLTRLVNLYISNNQLTELPENFGNLESLYILDLGYNQLTSMPESILNLGILTYLWIFNNQLVELPENFCDLNLNWDDDDTFGYPYFACGGNMLCENVPECVLNSDHFNTSLEQYYYSVQITVEQDCDWLNAEGNINELEFEIKNIYPNPFNPITNIDFSIAKSEKVSIAIYDLKGKLIEKLIDNKMMVPGNYNVIWDASKMPSGIYFVNFSNKLKTKNQKIILQK